MLDQRPGLESLHRFGAMHAHGLLDQRRLTILVETFFGLADFFIALHGRRTATK